jgi:NADH:ubiquinone oxidoreductase subunit 6 (subunit J)
MLAILREDSWNLPLFLHVLGAIAVTGATAAALVTALSSQRRAWLKPLLWRVMLVAVLPAWLLMRVAGQWTESKEDIPGDPGWLGVGFLVGDAGLILLLAATILSWVGARRPERAWPPKAVAAIVGLYLVALFVAMFAMTGKPGS